MGSRPHDREALLVTVSNGLLVLWVALIGADRIDLLGGRGSFVLTPFLILTPLVIASELVRIALQGGRVRLPGRTALYCLVVTCLLCVLLFSVLFSFDFEMASRRFILVFVEAYFTLAVAIVLANRSSPDKILVAGAYAGLCLGFVFNLVQLAIWLYGLVGYGEMFGGVLNLWPNTYGPYVPRLSGQAGDMNRGGMLFLFYMLLLFQFAKPSRLRAVFLVLGTAALLATLSRSVLLAASVAGAFLLWRTGKVRLSLAQAAGVSVAVALITAVLLASPRRLDLLLEFAQPIVRRFMPGGDESANIHVALIQRGIEVGTANLKQALVGVGFGNAFVVLQDFFPGNKYGNFHSLYVTLLAETGVVSLLLCLILLVGPLAWAGRYQPLLLAIIVFNLFYQSILEPMFWFVLAAVWTDLGTAGPDSPAVLPGTTEREPGELILVGARSAK